MAITIDYSDSATPDYIINIPRADMTLIQSSPVEIRQLNIDSFRLELAAIQAAEEGQVFPTAFEHTAPKTVAGVTLARVVEVLAPYSITFEDGSYNVNVVGGNSNISDRNNKNTVGVNTANSAGLQDPFALQAGAFGGGAVSIKASSGYSGTTFPVGTRSFPVDNLADALSIATSRGLIIIQVIGPFTLGSGDFSAGYIFRGDSPATTTITIDSAANVTDCEFTDCTVSGVLDGGNTFRNCTVGSISMFEGVIKDCGLNGTVTLGTGATAELIRCYSEVAGGGAGAYPTVDMGGSVGTDLLVREYSGGLGIDNLTDGAVVASFDFVSGRLVVDSTVSAGSITVRGICAVTDNSTGTAAVSDDTESAKILQALNLLEADQSFNFSTQQLHNYLRGTTIDLIPAKDSIGSGQTANSSLTQP